VSDPDLQVRRGIATLIYAYDVGQWIDLRACAERLTQPSLPSSLRHQRRAPDYFQFEPAPLRFDQGQTTITLAGAAYAVQASQILYDFGAVSIRYTMPIEGKLSDLVQLSAAASEDEGPAAEARTRVERLVADAGDAIDGSVVAPLVEDYLIFQIEEYEPELPPEELLSRHPNVLASILRAEQEEYSRDEIDDALASRISFTPEDLTLIDWNAALLFDSDADDVREVLEFANAQLLELRLLDDQLDHALDRAYDMISAQGGLRRPSASRAEMGRIGQMQVDGALVFERIRNALKLLGDQYLARLYRIAAQRFHFAEWDASILRKLETIESVYGKLFDRNATRRMEILEWLIILLIAAGIALPFLLPHLPW
jgi:hypothetical protein